MLFTKEQRAHKRRVYAALKAFRKRDLAARKQRPLHKFYVWEERSNTAVYPGSPRCLLRVAKLTKAGTDTIYDRMGPGAMRPVVVHAFDTKDARVQAARLGVSCKKRAR